MMETFCGTLHTDPPSMQQVSVPIPVPQVTLRDSLPSAATSLLIFITLSSWVSLSKSLRPVDPRPQNKSEQIVLSQAEDWQGRGQRPAPEHSRLLYGAPGEASNPCCPPVPFQPKSASLLTSLTKSNFVLGHQTKLISFPFKSLFPSFLSSKLNTSCLPCFTDHGFLSSIKLIILIKGMQRKRLLMGKT